MRVVRSLKGRAKLCSVVTKGGMKGAGAATHSGSNRAGGSLGHKIRLRFRVHGNNEEEYTLSLFTNEKVLH